MGSCQDTPPGVLTEEQEFARCIIFPIPSLPHPLNPFVQTQVWKLLGFFFFFPLLKNLSSPVRGPKAVRCGFQFDLLPVAREL